jgi:hypothetical protein
MFKRKPVLVYSTDEDVTLVEQHQRALNFFRHNLSSVRITGSSEQMGAAMAAMEFLSQIKVVALGERP